MLLVFEVWKDEVCFVVRPFLFVYNSSKKTRREAMSNRNSFVSSSSFTDLIESFAPRILSFILFDKRKRRCEIISHVCKLSACDFAFNKTFFFFTLLVRLIILREEDEDERRKSFYIKNILLLFDNRYNSTQA